MRLLVFFFLCTLSLSASTENTPALKDGYYLLRDLCTQEKKVSGILLFKTAPHSLALFLKKISREAAENVQTIDQFQQDDATLVIQQNPLPAAEIAARQVMDAGRQHQLLFGTSGPSFVLAMLLSQQFASDYAQSLAAALLDQEKNPQRRARLLSIRQDWIDLRTEAFQLLQNSSRS